MSKHYCKGKTVLYVIECFHKVGAFDGVKLFYFIKIILLEFESWLLRLVFR